MGVKNASITKGATIAVTGGTAVTFSPDGEVVPSGVHIVDVGNADFITRQSMTIRSRNPRLVNGEYTKAKRWFTYVVPQVLMSKKVVFNLVRIEIEYHPELTAANLTDMCKMGSQLLIDTDFESFISTGSLE